MLLRNLIHSITVVLLFIVAIAWLRLTYERTLLNQRYEQQIEQREEINRDYAEAVKLMQQRDEESAEVIRGFQDRFRAILERLESTDLSNLQAPHKS